MKIADNIEIFDLALYLIKEKTLVFADFHIGYEEALNKEGVLIPRFQLKETLERLERIFLNLKKNKKEINKIIVNGDLKHEFGTISEQEWRDALKLLDFLNKYCKEIVLIKGNHDTILGPIADKRNLEIINFLKINGILIIHGDKTNKNIEILIKKSKIIVIAHEHPAVSLKEGGRVETFKCFLKGKYKKKTLIVQPSFNLVTEGADVAKEKLLSPFLQQKLDDFEVYVIADKVYYFERLKNIVKF
ncbi:MAG: metallophosphoesterase [Candidatus Woesearchaeota archaeon]|nr:metallophosphoesterase [Candidatus Woesearchaeota archaeon]